MLAYHACFIDNIVFTCSRSVIVFSFYFAEGCAAPSIYFIIGPTNRCANFITGFGITTCTGAHALI